jgi:branched-chain amino acid transport system ATP-binding protein
MLSVQDIHVYYGEKYVLQGVSLEVRRGEIVALLGRNGVGKTTTLRTIMGLTKPRSGKISFKGIDITKLHAFEIARLGIGYVPQGRRLFPELTVLENLKTGFRGKFKWDSLNDVFELFPALKERINQKAGTLSGGEQQMLAIARALITEPELLLLDEPTTGLMPALVHRLKEVIKELNGQGLTVFLVEQKVPLALDICNRVYIMDKGQVVYHGTPEEAKKVPELLLRYLGVY